MEMEEYKRRMVYMGKMNLDEKKEKVSTKHM